jgi:antitoxin YefM
MVKEIPITEARHDLTSLPERLAKEPGAVAVTRRGKPGLAVMPWDLYESVVETLEIMGDEDLMTALRQGIKEAAEGKVIPWETVKAKLDL